jgi:hypothetical protein
MPAQYLHVGAISCVNRIADKGIRKECPEISNPRLHLGTSEDKG